ncbi:MAG: hypothetical protein KGN84_12690 [Acidobacteriota bacterium]|nr:hypothetical protein [Acidobacteriota bacterium]
MLNKQDQQVTVRILPGGNVREARIRELNGRLLSLEFSPAPGFINLRPGDLVEVTCTKTLYLGEVRSRDERTMIVGIEHSLDRETLAAIQRIWHGPGD